MSAGAEGRYVVRIEGRGRVEVAADGFADAEHLVDKELRRAWTVGDLEITAVGRPPGNPRIVDHFAVSYRLTADLEVRAASRASAMKKAVQTARGLLSDGRYQRTEWHLPEAPPPA